MLHTCPQCGSKDVNKSENEDIIQLCCNNCEFCWADYKNGAYKGNGKISSFEISDKKPEPEL